MTSQKQLLFAYGLAVHLLVVGIVCYAAFSAKVPEKPIRLMYKTAAGKVLFDHDIHCKTSGYGAICGDCHHHPSSSTDSVNSCSMCHQTQAESKLSSQSCSYYRMSEKVEDVEVVSRVDAFHTQCIECHKQIESGPKECSQCHIL